MNYEKIRTTLSIVFLLFSFMFGLVMYTAVEQADILRQKQCMKGLTEMKACGLLKHGSADCWFKVEHKYSFCSDIVGDSGD